jgi:glycosyltransferase involved in cell wall biosynthesis
MIERRNPEHATSNSVAFGPSPKASVLVTTLPRVLVYSNEFPQTGSAGGILLDRLFKDYPEDHLRIVGPKPQRASAPLRFRHHEVAMPWSRFEHSRFNRSHRTLRSFGLVPLKRPGQVDQLLEGFQPEVVLTVMQHGTWYDSAMHYAKARSLPLVTIIHDDNEGFDRVHSFARGAQRKKDGEFYRFAARRFCVSPEMEEEFARRYGVRGEVLYPNRSEDLGPRDPEMNASLRTPGRLTIGFVGNPNYGYGEQLVKMLPAIREAGAKLIVWGHAPGGAAAPLAEARDVVDLRGFIPSNEAWDAVKRECDAVVFPYLDPPGAMERMYSIHFPSKLPEYLALGMPIVMVGPECATGIRWARQRPDTVYLFDVAAPQRWRVDLERLCADAGLRSALGAGALRQGALDFDPLLIRRKFQSALREIAQEKTVSPRR